MISDRANAVRPAGATRRGPKSAAGKAPSARNALKHGLRARVMTLLDDEDCRRFFAAFMAAVRAELAPVGVFQADLARCSPPTSVVGAGSQARGS
jgi:hypothetical protein